MGLTAVQRNAILNNIFRNTALTAYATLYMSLHTANPTDTGGSEVTGGSYARKVVTFDAAASGATQNTAAVAFDGMPTATVTHFAIFSALTSGTLIGYGALTASKTTASGDTLNFAIGELDWSLT